MFILIFVLALAFVIMLHEFGHFITAKAFGMKVEKFFLGFGPTLWSVRRGETEYGVKAIPAGGFVKIIGMNQFEEVDPADAGRTFRDRVWWKRVIVLSAGSFTHFVVAWILLFGGLVAVGLPDVEATPTNEINQVVEGSPADRAGLQPGDRIVAIDGQPVTDFDGVRAGLQGRAGETVSLTVERDGERLQLEPTLADQLPDGTRGAFLGVGPQPVMRTYSVGEAAREVTVGDFSLPRLTGLTLGALGEAFRPSALAQWFSSIDDADREPTGPTSLVGAGSAVNSAGRSGDLFAVIAILAELNIVLGTLNMLPLPPLDGGHVAVLAIEETVNGVRRRRGRAGRWHLDPAIITPVALAVIVFFVAISFTALYADIVNPIDILGG